MRTGVLKISALAVATALSIVSAPAFAANLVTNGDFETGSLSGWTVAGGGSFPWGPTTSGPVSGTFAATTGCVGAACTTIGSAGRMSLGQTLATTAGDIYTLSFDFAGMGGVNGLNVLWNGASIFTLFNDLNVALTTYTVTGLVGAGGGSTLEFLGRQDPGFNRLDNVSVDLAVPAAVPEPATWAMMLVGFGAIGAAMRRRRQQAPKVRFAF